MEELALLTLFCVGPVVTIAAFAAALVAASANRRRRDEARVLRDDLDELRVHHLRLAQQVAALEAGPPQASASAPAQRELMAVSSPAPAEAAGWSTPAPRAPAVGEGMPAIDAQPLGEVGPVVEPLESSDTTDGLAPTIGETTVAQGGAVAAAPAVTPGVPAAATDLVSSPAAATSSDVGVAPGPASAPASPLHRGGSGPRPPQHPPAAPPARKGPGLEEWLGVRGIALLGALTLVVAGVYFFRYSVEHGLITPAMRVILGVLVGLVCVGVSEKPLRARHALLANFIAGAGVAILYLASWSSGGLYELVPRPVAFALMAVTTAVCCALAVRHRALSIAMFGLLGGFITPISLSTGQDRPLALFGYLLLLDVALLVVARRMRWGVLALLSVFGTFVYQLGWVLGRMGPERVWLGVGIVTLFALVFAAATLLTERKGVSGEGEARGSLESLVAKATQAFAVLLPFLFPVFFALHSDLRLDLLPTLVLVSVLTVGAGVISLSTRAYWLQVAAAVAGGVTLLLHVMAAHREPLGWLFVGLAASLAAIHFAVVERWFRTQASLSSTPAAPLEPTTSSDHSAPGLVFLPSHAFVLLSVAALCALVLGAEGVTPAGTALCALFIVVAAGRVAVTGGLPSMAALVGPLATVSVAAAHVAQGDLAGRPSEWVWLGLALLPVVAAQGGVLVRTVGTRRALDHAAGIAALVFAGHLTLLSYQVPVTVPLFAFAACMALVLVLLPLARSGVGAYFGPVVLLLAVRAEGVQHASAIAAVPLAWLASLVAIGACATWLPMLTLGERARASRGLYRGSALAMPLFFAPILAAYRDVFGHTSDGVPAVVAGAVVLTSLAVARARAPQSVRVSAMAWPAAAALGFVSVAVPLQLENEWVTVGWAVLGAGLLALFRRIDHAGLKYFALLHFAAVGVRLLLNPYILDYHPVSAWPFVNWIAYTYLVPTAAALAGFAWLRDIEVARRRRFEAQVMPAKVALFANALGVLAVALGFAWINLTIIDAFAPDGPLELDFDRRPARDLTLSLAWALYGGVLLGIGMWRKSTSLRGLSLGLVMLTIGKVFLVDLGNLQDLYRVASLVGLAMSLIVISLAYRRFVFPASDTDKQEGGPS
ncbi:MAG: DUF2339 domain-containing protein [Sandaracinaceae bacterium]|nr:DUF2339 domain-containing protein [Sandaracinaceae bacterium]